jgi:hypothetical protein
VEIFGSWVKMIPFKKTKIIFMSFKKDLKNPNVANDLSHEHAKDKF